MNFSKEALSLKEVYVIRSRRFVDARGYFMETWSESAFAKLGMVSNFVQDNESLSTRVGTIRGLHFQRAPFEQAKLIRVLSGRVFDVVVDIRTTSPTYGRWCGALLTAAEGEQLYVPRGFAHGFLTLDPETIVTYKVDAPYSPQHEGGIIWNDPVVGIEWPIEAASTVISDRDRHLPLMPAKTTP